MPFATMPGPTVSIFPIVIPWRAVSDAAAAPNITVPVKCRVYGVFARAHFTGGTAHTDVDLLVKNVTKSETMTAALAVVDSSTYAAVATTCIAGTDDLDAGDTLEVEADITGGSSPDTSGEVVLWCARE